MGYIPPSKADALVFVSRPLDGSRTMLVQVGTAIVGEDGKSLAIRIDEPVTLGPDTPLVVTRA